MQPETPGRQRTANARSKRTLAAARLKSAWLRERGWPALPEPEGVVWRDADCVFCDIVAGEAPATVVRSWGDTLAIKPRGGVHSGHVLVIPHTHVADVGENPGVSARTMACAAELAAELPAANVITSKGVAATQTVFHLHVHVVPRSADDGLLLPWSAQQAADGAA